VVCAGVICIPQFCFLLVSRSLSLPVVSSRKNKISADCDISGCLALFLPTFHHRKYFLLVKNLHILQSPLLSIRLPVVKDFFFSDLGRFFRENRTTCCGYCRNMPCMGYVCGFGVSAFNLMLFGRKILDKKGVPAIKVIVGGAKWSKVEKGGSGWVGVRP